MRSHKLDKMIEGCTVRIYDCGQDTALDHYTIIVQRFDRRPKMHVSWLGSGNNPFHPQGIGYHAAQDEDVWNGTYKEGKHLGKRVSFESIPEEVQKFAIQEAKDMTESYPK